ncbi:hypothetical protein RB195_002826 [Necator americanus]|uniref:CHCH domain protein n=1 Tax=Necator americanus TaxID=51031 RepID=A0ABR1DLP6_NECAM
MWVMEWVLRKVYACPKDEILFVSSEDHSKPLSKKCSWMNALTLFKKPIGPRYPDGSINWQCPCMAGGSLVAHRCGHYFRRLYVCMSENEEKDVTIKCPEQFIDWASCMQNMSDERRMQMRAHLLENDENEKS